MRKYRIIVAANGKKHTRHVRARDMSHAGEQAATISDVVAPGQKTECTIEDMGVVGKKERSMTDRQRAILANAFKLLTNGAKRGQRLAADATAPQVKAHVDGLAQMVAELQKGLDEHIGASSVLERAKTLSATGPRR